MTWRSGAPTPTRAEAWRSESLAGWREKYPDVPVTPGVVHAHPVPGLAHAAQGQHLVMVGSHGRRALAGTLLGSTSQGLPHHAACPVAVVPTHGG